MTKDEIIQEFGKDAEDDMLEGELIYANYELGDWEGEAFVLFRRNGKLYEVNGSHCSCYGLEGQWKPEETTKAELMHRKSYGYMQDNKAIKAVIEGLPE